MYCVFFIICRLSGVPIQRAPVYLFRRFRPSFATTSRLHFWTPIPGYCSSPRTKLDRLGIDNTVFDGVSVTGYYSPTRLGNLRQPYGSASRYGRSPHFKAFGQKMATIAASA